jgi:hypothetical protein
MSGASDLAQVHDIGGQAKLTAAVVPSRSQRISALVYPCPSIGRSRRVAGQALTCLGVVALYAVLYIAAGALGVGLIGAIMLWVRPGEHRVVVDAEGRIFEPNQAQFLG